jgi:hypothetical protein
MVARVARATAVAVAAAPEERRVKAMPAEPVAASCSAGAALRVAADRFHSVAADPFQSVGVELATAAAR